MKEFTYTATSRDGRQVSGKKEAETSAEVAKALHEQGLIVVSIQENLAVDFSRFANINIGKISLKDRMIIAKQLATMLGAGLPLIQSLDVLIQQTENKATKAELTSVYKAVEGGISLSKAFEKNSSIFDKLQVSLIAAGEKSGNLVEILTQLMHTMEKSYNLRSKIRGAMIYPAIIFVAMMAVIFVMIVFMIPTVKDLYDDLGISELPAVTQFFVNISNFLSSPAGLIVTIITIIAFIIGFRSYYSTKSGKRVIDKFLLRMPIFGKIFEYSQIVQMTRLLSMMIVSGLSIIDSIKTVSTALSNIHYKEAMDRAAVDVSKGVQLAVSLSQSDVIPIMLLKMVAIGEETGTLDKMLKDMSNFYDSELNSLADNLTKLMEPVILLVFGLIAALLALAVYSPIYTITQI
jgi:type IV pilus assembly protein PilC